MATEKEVKEKDEVEEAEIDAYMETDDKDSDPSEAEWTEYLKSRYENVKGNYKLLKLQKMEFEGRKDENSMNRLNPLFAQNYRERKYIVSELRKLGIEVEDRFVPSVV